jgi:hypothetical protein
MIGYWIQRTAGDWELRARLQQLGVGWITEAVVTDWSDNGALVRSCLDGSERSVAADTIVFATTNVSDTSVADELAASGFDRPVHLAGDVVAARLAVHAIYEGRVRGQQI